MPFDTRFAGRTTTQDAFFPADFILSSPQGVSKGEIGKIPCPSIVTMKKSITGK